MKMVDVRCTACEAVRVDVLLRDSGPESQYPACAVCGQPTERVRLAGKSVGVIPDEIPGGLEIKNALCHPDGTPKKFYSKSEIHREAAARGWVNHVEHIGTKGGDKSKHTSRWI